MDKAGWLSSRASRSRRRSSWRSCEAVFLLRENSVTRAVRVGDEYFIFVEKDYISGAGDPRC